MTRVSFFLFWLLFLFLNITNLSQSNFNIELYKQFLQSNQNMSSEQLLQMHPAGLFAGDQNLDLIETRYLDSISLKYGLTAHELELLSQNGFVVSERMSKISFGEAFLEIFHKDLPVFVSTDAILHAFHISYDRILKDAELGLLIDKVKTLLQTLHSQQSYLNTKYGNDPEMMKMLKDVDVYLTVPLKLFEFTVNPYYSENSGTIDTILQLIEAEQMASYNLFADVCRVIDWSQFKPRGHYDVDPNSFNELELPKYFRVMMWLGRTELYLTKPVALDSIICPLPSFKDVQRQIIDSYLVRELIDHSNSYNDYLDIENTIKIFAGDQDNVTLDHLTFMKNAVGFNDTNELLDSLQVVEFQDTLKNQSFAYQLILSQILFSDPFSPDSIIPASAFMLFGQRFVIDSYITASVVYDRIGTYCRLFPSLLDVLFSLGNSASAQLLVDELNTYHYSSNLAALRYLIDAYDDEFWEANLYSNWLNIIRKLNPPIDRTNLPPFMQTAAFWQEKMNTQLASWTELRHDNLLYAKQSYTGGSICSYPYSYVEPFPEFYQTLKDFSITASNKIQTINFSDPGTQNNIVSYFNTLGYVMDTLKIISEKELNQELLTTQEIHFLQSMIYENYNGGSGETPYKGWYPKLFYNDDYVATLTTFSNPGLMESDHLVADMHTIPTDCGGTPMGWVKHVGTGPINLGVFVAQWNDGVETAYIGPVMSYYEYTTTNFLRLTDQEWNDQYLQSALRPEWVNIYLADSTGNSRGEGPSLITSVQSDPTKNTIPQSELLISNYPNPFNATTLIVFTIPYNLTNKNVELKVYDVQGRLVTTLVNEQLAAGNYIVKWAGKNDNLQNVASGIYFYNIKVGEQVKSGKMNLLK
ncbi:MAG: DUF3160 domain-containing protein [Ignavibacteriaceae bacterium]